MEELKHKQVERFPGWVDQLVEAHGSGTSQTYILHGNVNDLVCFGKGNGTDYVMLPEFLASQVFGNWDMVIYYDQVRGPRAMAGSAHRLGMINKNIDRFIGTPEKLKMTREPGKVMALLDRCLELVLLTEKEKPSVAIIMDYAQFIVPSTSVSYTTREMASNLATLLSWAKSPYFKKISFAFCLISERLSDLNSSIVRNAYTTKIEIPFPDENSRQEYLKWISRDHVFETLCEVNDARLANLTSGLGLIHLQGLVNGAIRTDRKIMLDDIKKYKKKMIESQCEGLVEFIEPKHSLDMVVGHEEAKKRLREDSDLMMKGHQGALPMGYLFCGPVGTGKTFLAECYAGSANIPCLKLLNFRSKYVGETEGNLEKILKVLRVMSPVAVIIDEADAMLGDRGAGGDSGTSGRVFGQFATQMGDTSYRGKIVWFLLTCRPDLLPIDLKRQGRCEVHIPLFTPESPETISDMFLAMAKKSGADILKENIPKIPEDIKLSGADIEGIVTRAKRNALLAGVSEITGEHIKEALDSFVPSPESDEKKLQLLAAVLECTDLKFLTDKYRQEMISGSGKSGLMELYRRLKAAEKIG